MVIGIIEDDRLLSEALEITFQKEGYQTKCIYTRQEAKECLDGTEELLIIDIGLPDGNGIEFYQNLIARRWKKKIPAIFLTARDEEVGKGIKESGIEREEIFLTSKLDSSCNS